MGTTDIYRRIGRLATAVAITVAINGAVLADPSGMTGKYNFAAMFPDGCRSTAHDDTRPPADRMQAFAAELGLSGQQQQDLKILTADYAERLRDLGILMRESGEKLIQTEPGDPNYWPLAQEVSATAATSSAETVILISEMREKLSMVLTAEQHAELKRRIDARKAACKPKTKEDQPAG